jgi:hypothetical protein
MDQLSHFIINDYPNFVINFIYFLFIFFIYFIINLPLNIFHSHCEGIIYFIDYFLMIKFVKDIDSYCPMIIKAITMH